MNRHVNAISGRLSLRPPQRRSLEILDRVTEIVPLRKDVDSAQALAAIRSEFPTVTEFEREFPSLCFALATGVGKTRLMGAFISYLHLAHGINNFFVLAPNLTIYNKLITDFTPNTAKYVFTGIAEFATDAPDIITGDNYEGKAGTLFDQLHRCKINIFNISKINSEVRGGKAPRIKRLSEYIGESYFEYLANLKDLVLIMDESHRYRASAGVRAINELKPILGLELTATPYVESKGTQVDFKNIAYHYRLANAMADGFVKEPAVVTRKNFNPSGMSPEEIERLKLEDGVRLHEIVKVELETYARENNKPIVKPFLLVIARDTSHASQLLGRIQSESFFAGRYKEKVIQVDSSKTGAEEEEMIERLLRVEHTDEPTEIVIHVNMLKEGWDVTNLYTIVPLRAAHAKVLIEQSIGRGLRLPYGRRTGVTTVDRLNIVAHDRFQEIIDEANKADSLVRLQAVELSTEQLGAKTVTYISQPSLANRLGLSVEQVTNNTIVGGVTEPPLFSDPEEQKIARLVHQAVRKLETQPAKVPSLAYLQKPEIQAMIVKDVEEQYQPAQLKLEEVTPKPDIAAIVAKTTEEWSNRMIAIPRVQLLPKSEVKSGFKPFHLKLDTLNYPAVSDELWAQHLRTNQIDVLTLGTGGVNEKRLEDLVVAGLVDFDDVSYDDHSDLLYDLAGQTVRHFLSYLSEDETRKVLRCYQRDITRFIHAQMQDHFWEDKAEYESNVSAGFTELKRRSYTQPAGEPPLDFRTPPDDLSHIDRYLFTGFTRCLYTEEKFQSDTERRLALILDRDSLKWFKPAREQFQIYYRDGTGDAAYQPDFVAEAADAVYLLEAKARSQLQDSVVLAKKEAAVKWCELASRHNGQTGGKPWKYAIIPHDAVADNMTLEGLIAQFGDSSAA